ncbi:MAG: SRPBCC domain-containing protein [Chitinophagaceae bacterium]|nr:MAG: SRPBCC domain-containing protein [Chitinophagaceae bacterium]
MILDKETRISKTDATTLEIDRYFDAPPAAVWRAWTEPQLLDQWWAPRPWMAVTKSMDFRDGGSWLYYMQGPEGERQHCRADYSNIRAGESYEARDAFTDEAGTPTGPFPNMHWHNEFRPEGDGTLVHVTISFGSEAGLQQIVDMGFKEGFTMANSNLDELLMR